ncbi:MAG: hypothetical protein L7S52_04035 [Flavobacteriaceae bacterium]|nr:hypothetical protein [Flavobacteriaceae bacterium]
MARASSISDLETLKRLFLFFVLTGFFVTSGQIGFVKGDSTALLPLMIWG